MPFALFFVLSNAYAGITWQQDFINISEILAHSGTPWIAGLNKLSPKTWVGSDNQTYRVTCSDTINDVLNKTANSGLYTVNDYISYVGNAVTTNKNTMSTIELPMQLWARGISSNQSAMLFCLLVPDGYSYNTSPEEVRNAENIGVIYNITLSTIAYPVLSTTGLLALGDVHRDETVTRPVPLSMSYAGGTDESKTLTGTVSWVITPATDNPSPLMPVIKKGGVPVESFTVSLTNAQIQSDDFTVSLTGNEYPGAYSWTMNITTTIE
ncbi:TPA: hypothetical protein LA654_004013 [Salmonella enterica]|uniref:Uncharacterized protein n=5 Tax=Enterobacteriaceae TaxID=543 RepID=A0A6X7M320_SALEB|nr:MULTISPECIES: hypothetical protein [Enterobacteriaceae]ECL3879777.1 hypothetical protein [Salmonella enterica subsp. enterica]EFC5880907.1 hypothetical protein [Escherichia coli]EKY1903420.1 hypothetical protein [Cronobacter sakazakii]BCG50907.1 hypothetical protein [Enterobacter cloacae]HAB1453981.1 hypothetical protein [Salmonella enterica subsp. enterica serovar Java]HCC0035565.1 hypothetical protein [Salmonella enterica subsp. enterica serovar Paratyphi B]HCQ0109803.1 hypothetical pro